jgi:Flp pilus assembly protein TadD
VASSLARIGYPDAGSLFKAFLLDESEAREFAQDGPLNSDNLPLLEYRAPRSLYSSTALQENARALMGSKSPESFPAMNVKAGNEGPAASLLKDWGKTLAQRRTIANAKGAFARAASIDPADDQAHFYLGLIRMQTGDQSGAIRAFEQAVALNSTLGEAHSNLGTLFLQTGEMAKAHAHLNKSLALGNDSSGLRNNLAVIYAKSSRMEDAIREARTALRLDPTNRVARENLNSFLKFEEKP